MNIKQDSIVTLWNGTIGKVKEIIGTKANVLFEDGSRSFVNFSDIVQASNEPPSVNFVLAKKAILDHNKQGSDESDYDKVRRLFSKFTQDPNTQLSSDDRPMVFNFLTNSGLNDTHKYLKMFMNDQAIGMANKTTASSLAGLLEEEHEEKVTLPKINKESSINKYAPGKVDEPKWKEAEEAIAKSQDKNKSDFGDKEWAMVNKTYQNMGGTFESKASVDPDFESAVAQIVKDWSVSDNLESQVTTIADALLVMYKKNGGNADKTRKDFSDEYQYKYMPGTDRDAMVRDLYSVIPVFTDKVAAKKPHDFKAGDKAKLKENALLLHSRTVPEHAGYTSEQFSWRKTLDEHEGQIGTIKRVFENSSNVNLEFPDGVLVGIKADLLDHAQGEKTAGHPKEDESKYPIGQTLIPTEELPEKKQLIILDIKDGEYTVEQRPWTEDLPKEGEEQIFGIRYKIPTKELDKDKDWKAFAGKKTASISQDAVIKGLNPLEEDMYEDMLDAYGGNIDKALEVIVNTVEGDVSQLSGQLAAYAKEQGWLEGYDDPKARTLPVSLPPEKQAINSPVRKGLDYGELPFKASELEVTSVKTDNNGNTVFTLKNGSISFDAKGDATTDITDVTAAQIKEFASMLNNFGIEKLASMVRIKRIRQKNAILEREAEDMTSYKGFSIGDQVSVKVAEEAYNGDVIRKNYPDESGMVESGMVGTITAFPPKVRMTEVSETTDALPYFAKVVFDKTFGPHNNPYEGGIDIKNLVKSTEVPIQGSKNIKSDSWGTLNIAPRMVAENSLKHPELDNALLEDLIYNRLHEISANTNVGDSISFPDGTTFECVFSPTGPIAASIRRIQKKAARLGQWDFDQHNPIWKLEAGEDGKKKLVRVTNE
jgi:hypothetical protein